MEIIYFLLSFIQPILLFTPEVATIAAGSIAFGPFKGFIIGYAGIISGIIAMYFIGRFGREKILKRFIKDELMDKFTSYAKSNQSSVIAMLFVFPVLPDNIICAGAGITRISFKPFLIIAGITKLITTFVYAYSMEVLELLPITQNQIIIGAIILFGGFTYYKLKKSKNRNNHIDGEVIVEE